MDSLTDAIVENDVATVQELLDSERLTARMQYWALLTAVDHNPTVLPLLLESGVDINADDGDGGDTVLMHAAATGNVDAVRWMLDHGANINARNSNWETPFSYACAWDHLDVAKLLSERGADIDCIHRGGGTPINDTCSPKRILDFLASIGCRYEEDIPEDERSCHIGKTPAS